MCANTCWPELRVNREKSMSNAVLKAGVARIEITPPVGFRMPGAMRRVEPSAGIESPLLATALVLGEHND